MGAPIAAKLVGAAAAQVKTGDLLAQAEAFWDASSLSYLADGASIRTVADTTGNGNALYYNSAVAPALTKATDSVTGKAVMRGDGTQGLVATPLGSGEPNPAGLNAPVTFMTVVRPSATQVSAGPGLLRAGVTLDAHFDNNLTPGGVLVAGNGLTNAARLFNPPLFDGKGHVIFLQITAAATNVYVDGYFQSTITGNLLGDGAFTQPIVSRYLVGDTMAGGVWSRKLTQNEIYDLTVQMNRDWQLGLSLGGNGAAASSVYESLTTTDGSSARLYTPGRPSDDPVLVLWSHPQSQSISISDSYFAYAMLRAANARGWYVALSNMGYSGSPGGSGSSWGNPTAQTALRQLYDAVAARIGKAPKVILIGGSMGGLAQALAIQKATLPAGVVKGAYFIDAVFDLAAMYKISSPTDYSATIDLGYGISAGTLSAAASASATTISSSVSYANGTSLIVDPFGSNPETVITSGTPSGSGPYTITLAAPLGYAHASGVKVSDFPTKTAGNNPMTNSVANFAGLPLRFQASSGDLVVVMANHTTPFQARVAATAKEAGVLTHLGGHLHASSSNPQDFISFIDRAIQ